MDNYAGYYEMYGAAIRLAIKDYVENYHRIDKMKKERDRLLSKHFKKRTVAEKSRICFIDENLRTYDSAKEYLFNPMWLERFIIESNLPLSISYLRKQIKEMLENPLTKKRRCGIFIT